MHNLQSFVDKLNQLATNFQKKFNKAQQLSLDDMIALTAPPKYTRLVEAGEFKITSMAYSTNTLTDNNGSTIAGTAFIPTNFYSAAGKQLIHDQNTRPPFTVRLHLDIVKTNGNKFNWLFYGSGYAATVNPKVGIVESDTELPNHYAITDINPIQFLADNSSTVINLATSYIELIPKS
ncbi:hypothetical protein [Limosilactobacillus oris]|uniref:hypothetical protein n=1 Tax=Limosilactobacillus oris TaxID=1632 RepID=UPI0024B34791|nr:hypothetical protein [Limosilactobacillus oris]WHO86482.1 hypothetical protein QLX69_04575 [Limosilactobacillus oris]